MIEELGRAGTADGSTALVQNLAREYQEIEAALTAEMERGGAQA